VLSNAGIDPELGWRLEKAQIEGKIKNAGAWAGSLKVVYQSSLRPDAVKAQFNFGLREVNLDALRFFYEDSLPVNIAKGTLDLTSDTVLDNGGLDSRNKLALKDHELKPKGSIKSSGFAMSMPVLCDSLNKINPLSLDFTISGTLDKPQFNDFTQSLVKLAKPNLKNISEAIIKSEIGGKDVEKAVNVLQSLLGDNKQDPK
jgi:hypothetical protein